MAKNKGPKLGASDKAQRKPAVGVSASPLEDGSQDIVWRFGDIDIDCAWGWGGISDADARYIHSFLSDMEKKTWAQAYKNTGMGVKKVRVAEIPNAAVLARLEAIHLDDTEDLWEFHLGGLKRVWGIRRGSVCYLLWWDPGHRVWPVKKK